VNFLPWRDSLRFLVGQGTKVFLTFAIFKASFIVEGSAISESFNRFLQRGKVTGA